MAELTAGRNFDSHMFTSKHLDHLDEVWDVYGRYDGKFLEDLTHQEDPWIEARHGYAPSERCTVDIDTNRMKMYYRQKLKE